MAEDLKQALHKMLQEEIVPELRELKASVAEVGRRLDGSGGKHTKERIDNLQTRLSQRSKEQFEAIMAAIADSIFMTSEI